MNLLEKVRLTVLVDNHRITDELDAEHGFCCLVEADGYRLLFDTGANNALLHNSLRLGICLRELNALVLSHGHYDHTGGLAAIGNLVGSLQVYAHPDVFGAHHSRRTGVDRNIGIPPASVQVLERLKLSTSIAPIEVCPGVWTTGEIRRVTQNTYSEALYADADGKKPDPLRDDMALVLRHRSGLILLLGCAHAGVIDTIRHVEELFPNEPFLGILGGMHLNGAGPDTLQAVAAVLNAKNVRFVAPGHCTGDTTIQFLKTSMGQRVYPLHVAQRLEINGTDKQFKATDAPVLRESHP